MWRTFSEGSPFSSILQSLNLRESQLQLTHHIYNCVFLLSDRMRRERAAVVARLWSSAVRKALTSYLVKKPLQHR
jgi:hypothetical protein